jgi:hypothetical protein
MTAAMRLFAGKETSDPRLIRSLRSSIASENQRKSSDVKGSLDSTLDRGASSMHEENEDLGNAPEPLDSLVPFLELPIELIQEIYDYLPLQSKACLSLTCKAVLSAIGNKSWKDSCITAIGHIWVHSNANTTCREEFLSILSRDLKEWDFCATCKMLHPALKSPREFRPKKNMKPCLSAEGFIDYHPMSGEDGYILTFEHIQKALQESATTKMDGQIADSHLNGSYTITYPNWQSSRPASYNLTFSSTRTGGNLILQITHRFSPRSIHKPLQPEDILDIPLRLCPHQTTSTFVHTERKWWDNASKRVRQKRYNGPLLTHTITSVFPPRPLSKPSCLRWQKRQPVFRAPTMTEENQMAFTSSPDHLWWCRSCPTKYKVERDEKDDTVTVTAWHNFGMTEGMARQSWRALVRSPWSKHDYRNSANWEFDAVSRSFTSLRF